MKINISLSAKQVGTLYHYTTKRALLKILRSGLLEMSAGRGMLVEHKHLSGKSYFASLTRSRFGGYHYHENGNTSVFQNTDVMITIDGDALSATQKIVPIDYWEQRGNPDPNTNRNKEVEERLVSSKPEVPILRYIKRVDLIQRAVHGEVETYGFDTGKFKLRPNERHQDALASIILQLKKNKIPFAFYDNMDDWAKQRNEYSYVGPKGVDVDAPKGYQNPRSYSKLVALVDCLSNIPYEKLSKPSQEICNQLLRYPNDVDAVFNDYENFRKPDAPSAMRTVAMKVARVMQRLGFNDKREAGKFIANKADVYYKAKEKRDRDERNDELAPLYLTALMLPKDQWTDTQSYYGPKKVFDIADRWSYMYDEAVRFMKSMLETDTPNVRALKAEMQNQGIADAEEFVSKIYYDKIKN